MSKSARSRNTKVLVKSGKLMTYDRSLDREAWRLASTKNSSRQDRDRFAQSVILSGRERVDARIVRTHSRSDGKKRP